MFPILKRRSDKRQPPNEAAIRPKDALLLHYLLTCIHNNESRACLNNLDPRTGKNEMEGKNEIDTKK